MKRLSKNSYLCRLTPYLLIGNIKKHSLRKQIQSLLNCNTFKIINDNRSNVFYIVHPSAKEKGKIQATFFYNNIPYSDMIRDNLEQIIDELSSMGYLNITDWR